MNFIECESDSRWSKLGLKFTVWILQSNEFTFKPKMLKRATIYLKETETKRCAIWAHMRNWTILKYSIAYLSFRRVLQVVFVKYRVCLSLVWLVSWNLFQPKIGSIFRSLGGNCFYTLCVWMKKWHSWPANVTPVRSSLNQAEHKIGFAVIQNGLWKSNLNTYYTHS